MYKLFGGEFFLNVREMIVLFFENLIWYREFYNRDFRMDRVDWDRVGVGKRYWNGEWLFNIFFFLGVFGGVFLSGNGYVFCSKLRF